MTEEIRHSRLRPVFAVAAGVVLAGLVVMIGVVMVGLTRGPESAEEKRPLPPPPPKNSPVIISNVAYVENGDVVRYDYMTVEPAPDGGTVLRPAGEKKVRLQPAESDVPAPADRGAVTRLMKEVLRRAGAIDPRYPTLALSPRGMEVVFTIAFEEGNSLIRRRPDGWYEHLTPHGVVMDFERLNGLTRPPEALEDRLASPDLWVWMDASLEYLLRHGASVHPIARRLRTVRAQRNEVGVLLGIFDNPEAPDLLRESVLLAADAGEEPAIGSRVRDVFLTNPEGAVAAFAAVFREGLPVKFPAAIRAWLLSAIPQVAPADAKTLAQGLAGLATDDDYGALAGVARRSHGAARLVATFVAMRLRGEKTEFDALTDARADEWWESYPPK